jgi:DNA-binding NarL/FixJ family response regulator
MDTLTRVLIADDHEIFRLGLVKAIERDKNFSIVAQAGDGGEALALIRDLLPDIAILDVSMPVMDGLEVGRAVYREALITEVIFLTMYKDVAYFNAAMDIGVRGYLLKDNASADLLTCLRTVNDGKHYISPTIAHYLIERQRAAHSLAEIIPALQRLSPAERRILALLSRNLTSKEIADKLFVSVRTIENHRTHMCRKLDIKGHNKLLQFAMENKTSLDVP